MSIDKAVLAFSGLLILFSLALTYYVNANWVWLTAFVGVNLLQASVSSFCPLAFILKKMGVASGAAFG